MTANDGCIKNMFSAEDFEIIQIIQEASELSWSEFLLEAVLEWEHGQVSE